MSSIALRFYADKDRGRRRLVRVGAAARRGRRRRIPIVVGGRCRRRVPVLGWRTRRVPGLRRVRVHRLCPVVVGPGRVVYAGAFAGGRQHDARRASLAAARFVLVPVGTTRLVSLLLLAVLGLAPGLVRLRLVCARERDLAEQHGEQDVVGLLVLRLSLLFHGGLLAEHALPRATLDSGVGVRLALGAGGADDDTVGVHWRRHVRVGLAVRRPGNGRGDVAVADRALALVGAHRRSFHGRCRRRWRLLARCRRHRFPGRRRVVHSTEREPGLGGRVLLLDGRRGRVHRCGDALGAAGRRRRQLVLRRRDVQRVTRRQDHGAVQRADGDHRTGQEQDLAGAGDHRDLVGHRHSRRRRRLTLTNQSLGGRSRATLTNRGVAWRRCGVQRRAKAHGGLVEADELGAVARLDGPFDLRRVARRVRRLVRPAAVGVDQRLRLAGRLAGRVRRRRRRRRRRQQDDAADDHELLLLHYSKINSGRSALCYQRGPENV